jgi:hypothetical protein
VNPTMTLPSAGADATPPVVVHRPTVRHARVVDPRRQWLCLLAVVAGPVLGVLAIGVSYRTSIAGGEQSPFAWFWLGMLLGVTPLAVRAAGRVVPGWERQLLVAAMALFTFAPKYLRDAAGPLYYDERAHWLQVRQVVAGGRLFVANDAVPIVQYYPGLHALSAVLVVTTGLSAWTIAEIVIAVVHTLGAVAVFLLATTMLPPRGAAIAAMVYMTNAEWVYFDTQFAYESLGVTLVLWTLYFAARLYQARDRADRWRWTGLTVAAGAVCMLSHHLSTVALAGVLTLCLATLGVAALLDARRETRARLGRLGWLAAPTAVIVLLLAGYLTLVAPDTSAYLSASVRAAVSQLLGLFSAHRSGSHTPFAGSGAPGYERYAAFGAPVLVGLAVGWHLLSSRGFSRLHRRGLLLPLSCLACVYLATVPLVLTASGSEVARRSWAFSYLGVAVVGGLLAVRLLRALPGWRGATAVGGALVLLMVGNLAAGENVAYRFPGPYILGSDVRSVTANMLTAETWWAGVRSPGAGVVADRYNGVLYEADLGTRLATFEQGPIMDFYLTDTPPTRYLAQALAADGVDYLVVDKNITTAVPLLGVYFAPDEPVVDQHPEPVPPAIIERWADSPYTTRVYDSDQITIYRLDPRYVAVTRR